MTQYTLLSRKLSDVDAALAALSRMDAKQFDVKARAPDLYDETVHLAALAWPCKPSTRGSSRC
jgi:hypothetical protein